MTATLSRTLPVVPDARWWLENIPCQAACPVHTDAGAYVTAIADGDFEGAYRIARAPNPFPSICGRVCAAPCESRCRRGAIDAPVAIRALKRVVSERFGVEAANGASLWRAAIGDLPPETGRRVAIVGGGPAGLACAHDLRRLGHAVTLHESSSRLGGMMVRGIPPFRLARDLVHAEIEGIVALGVDVHLHSRVGVDVTMAMLLSDFDAVFVAAGTGVGRLLDVEGQNLPGVTSAVAFLADCFSEGKGMAGERVIVVGGGSVAFDAARTAARTLGTAAALRSPSDDAPSEHGTRPLPGVRSEGLTALLDAARTARHAGGREVTIVSLETRTELSAEPDELHEAESEGVRLLHRRAVRRVLGRERVEGVAIAPVRQVFASDGRFAPEVDDEGAEEVLPCDMVIFAVGQEADTSFLPAPLVRGSLAAVEAATLRTPHPKVWAGGDIAFGPRHLIDAIADGRRAAAGIGAALRGIEEESGSAMPSDSADRGVVNVQGALPWRRQWTDYDVIPRAPLPATRVRDRDLLRELEQSLPEALAVREAQRCLRCHANVTLRADRCILCGLCADVCPERCIRLEATGEGRVALLLDEARCIRCGLCVERCPPQALTMVSVHRA